MHFYRCCWCRFIGKGVYGYSVSGLLPFIYLFFPLLSSCFLYIAGGWNFLMLWLEFGMAQPEHVEASPCRAVLVIKFIYLGQDLAMTNLLRFLSFVLSCFRYENLIWPSNIWALLSICLYYYYYLAKCLTGTGMQHHFSGWGIGPRLLLFDTPMPLNRQCIGRLLSLFVSRVGR